MSWSRSWKGLLAPVLATMLLAACSDTTALDTRPGIRFLNAIPGMTGSGGFTANGQFASGSALALGQATALCMKIDSGATSFGYGAANTAGTGLSGNALATLDDQSMPTGGDFTLVAAGSAASPTLFLLDNRLAGSLEPNQAAVRFVNFAPGTGTTPDKYFAYLGPVGSTTIATNLEFGVPSAFASLTSGANTFSVLKVPGHDDVIPASAHTLQAGSANTMAIVPNASGGVALVNLPGCS